MREALRRSTLPILLLGALCAGTHAQETGPEGWLRWRGPDQNGYCGETDLPVDVTPGGPNELWSFPLRGRGSAVTAGDRVYAIGYRGEGAALEEVLVCLELATGKPIWERGFSDFISDIIYERYSIGAPAVDPETGTIYAHTSPGLLVAFSPDGTLLWQRSLMEELGRLTFPNGRTGAPAVDGALVVVNAITSSWGGEGPARNRFYAFDKRTGELVWSATPGTGPKDSSFSSPVFTWRGNRRVLYAGTGCGHVVCVDMTSGETLWRYRISYGGVNASVLVKGDRLIAIHGKENIDTTVTGGMFCLDLTAPVGEDGVLSPKAELWRSELSMFTASPTLVGDRIYQVTAHGELYCVDFASGAILWHEPLANVQLHASPLYADGRLYIPLWDGEVAVVKPGDEGCEVLAKIPYEGSCIGSATAWRKHLFIHSTERLFCFKKPGVEPGQAPPARAQAKPAKPHHSLCIVPSDVVLQPGEVVPLRLVEVWPGGLRELSTEHLEFRAEGVVPAAPPPSVKVVEGKLIAATAPRPSAGHIRVIHGEREAVARVRVLPAELDLDFEAIPLREEDAAGGAYAHPPGAWIGGRLKWQVREVDGSKVLQKTLDRVLFQRTMTFIGEADAHGYTIEADVRSDGTRRLMSNVGVICQRYILMLEGNWQQLQVVSNHDRVKVGVPFTWKPRTWYRIRARVDSDGEGGVIVRASAWPRDEEPPEGWLLEVPLERGHQHGAPGLFGFSPQSRYAVMIDNVTVTNTGDE